MSTGFEICEEFTCSLPATGAQDFTLPIVHYTRANRLKLVGKGFDGAATMAGHCYTNEWSLTHCRNHALNLVQMHSSSADSHVTDYNSTKSTTESSLNFFSANKKLMIKIIMSYTR